MSSVAIHLPFRTLSCVHAIGLPLLCRLKPIRTERLACDALAVRHIWSVVHHRYHDGLFEAVDFNWTATSLHVEIDVDGGHDHNDGSSIGPPRARLVHGGAILQRSHQHCQRLVASTCTIGCMNSRHRNDDLGVATARLIAGHCHSQCDVACDVRLMWA